MVSTGEFYAGSQLFSPLVNVIGLPIDQVNFLLCQFTALALAIPFRKVYGPKTTSPTTRHIIEVSIGLALTYFCFGYQIWHLLLLSLVCYIIMWLGDPRWKHKAVFGFAMCYLSVTHMFRQIYDYGGYTLDITGPIMIMVQKLTSLAFALHDGATSPDKLNADQKNQAVKSLPDILSFSSYLFCFHGIMCGPLTFYSDYNAFIEGRNFSQATKVTVTNGTSKNVQKEDDGDIYQTNKVVLQKLCLTAFVGFLMIVVTPKVYNATGFSSTAFYEMSFFGKHIFLLVAMTFARCKYYFAWKLGETVNNAAGLGFTGFNDKGQPDWSLVDNCDIYQLETCNSLKLNIDCWNKTTLVWLRRVVYDRLKKYHTLAVFSVSALWHGFYPGYYLTFATGALLTIAARYIRRNIRPIFLQSTGRKVFYDAATFIFTRLANVYMCAPFTILELVPCLVLYTTFYWWMHLLAIGVIIFYTFISPSKKSYSSKKVQ